MRRLEEFRPAFPSRLLYRRSLLVTLGVITALRPSFVWAQSIQDSQNERTSSISGLLMPRSSARLCLDQTVLSDNDPITQDDVDALSDIFVYYSGFSFSQNPGLFPFLRNLSTDDLSKPEVFLKKYPHKFPKNAYGYDLSVAGSLLQGTNSLPSVDTQFSVTCYPNGDDLTDQPTSMIVYQLNSEGQLVTLPPVNTRTRDVYNSSQLLDFTTLALANSPKDWNVVNSGRDKDSIVSAQLDSMLLLTSTYTLNPTLRGWTRISLV